MIWMRNQRGFTIMELMIVIVIIGILAAIAVPSFNQFTASAKSRSCEANRRTISAALAVFYADNNGTHATALNQLDAYVEGGVPPCPDRGTYSIVGGKIYCSQHAAAPGGGI